MSVPVVVGAYPEPFLARRPEQASSSAPIRELARADRERRCTAS